jgi:hypothetical protein
MVFSLYYLYFPTYTITTIYPRCDLHAQIPEPKSGMSTIPLRRLLLLNRRCLFILYCSHLPDIGLEPTPNRILSTTRLPFRQPGLPLDSVLTT